MIPAIPTAFHATGSVEPSPAASFPVRRTFSCFHRNPAAGLSLECSFYRTEYQGMHEMQTLEIIQSKKSTTPLPSFHKFTSIPDLCNDFMYRRMPATHPHPKERSCSGTSCNTWNRMLQQVYHFCAACGKRGLHRVPQQAREQ